MAALEPVADPRRAAERLLGELVPLDEERRAESEVWLAFTGHALVDPTPASIHRHPRSSAALRVRGHHAGRRRPGRGDLDVRPGGQRLPALLDGLALHAVMRPEQVPPSRVTAVIARHLDLQADGAVLVATADVEQLPSSWRRLRLLIEPCAVQAALACHTGLLSDELTPCTR